MIALANNSGGPKLDIVNNGTGYLANSAVEYQDRLHEIFSLTDAMCFDIQTSARKHVREKFGESQFKKQFLESWESL